MSGSQTFDAGQRMKLARLLNLSDRYKRGHHVAPDELEAVHALAPFVSVLVAQQKGAEISPADFAAIAAILEGDRALTAIDPAPGPDQPTLGHILTAPPAFRARTTRKHAGYPRPYADYASTFAVSERAIKSWVRVGKKKSDLPPLDNPPAMVDWWPRHFQHRVPAKILEARRAAPPLAAPAGTLQLPDPTAILAAADRMSAIDLDTTLEPDAGAQVRQAFALTAANYRRLQEASATGDRDAFRRWFPIYVDSSEHLRKVTKEDRDSRKSSAAYVEKSSIQADLDEAVDMLKMMRENMERRLREKLHGLDSPLIDRVIAVVLAVREKEDLVFRGLPSLGTPADALSLLAA